MKPPKTVSLIAARVREVLDYDPETGVLAWRVDGPGCVAGALAGLGNVREAA